MTAEDDREIAAQKVREMAERLEADREVAAGQPAEPQSEDTTTLDDVLAMTARRIGAEDARRRALPCMQAIYRGPAPDGYLDAQREHGELVAACTACDAMEAEKACPDAPVHRFCAQRLLSELEETTRQHLRRGGVEEREHKLILAAARRHGAKPLADQDTLRLVRAFLKHQRAAIRLEDAAEVNPLTGDVTPNGARLNGGERILVLAGNPGRGKTVAACYAIGRFGGIYMTEYALATPASLDLPRLKRAPGILVIDQVGRARMGDKRTAALVLEEIVDARYASKLDTILCANMAHAAFAERYKRVLLDRIAGDGLFVVFSGESLRPLAKEGA